MIIVLNWFAELNSHRRPVFLPDGIHVLYSVRSLRAERRGVHVVGVDHDRCRARRTTIPVGVQRALCAARPRRARRAPVPLRMIGCRCARSMHVSSAWSGTPRPSISLFSGSTPYHLSMFSVSDAASTVVLMHGGNWCMRLSTSTVFAGACDRRLPLKCAETPTELGHNPGHNHLRLDPEPRK
jgi:hypothetical protein